VLEPLTVWKVELAHGLAHRDVAGTLTLGADALEFEADEAAAPMHIGYAAITRAKRLRLSAVLLVRWESDGTTRLTAFYLAQPPPLAPPDPGEAGLRTGNMRVGFLRPTKRGQRRRNTAYLAYTGADLKPALRAWTAEVRVRVRATRGG